MYFFISMIVAIIVYVVTFKHEYNDQEFSKLTPMFIILGVMILLLGNK